MTQSKTLAGDKLTICRCEEVTEEEIRDAIRRGARSISEIKRVTRAGMGICQGRTCRRLVTKILMEMTGMKVDEVDQDTPRPPLRPTSLQTMCEDS